MLVSVFMRLTLLCTKRSKLRWDAIIFISDRCRIYTVMQKQVLYMSFTTNTFFLLISLFLFQERGVQEFNWYFHYYEQHHHFSIEYRKSIVVIWWKTYLDRDMPMQYVSRCSNSKPFLWDLLIHQTLFLLVNFPQTPMLAHLPRPFLLLNFPKTPTLA